MVRIKRVGKGEGRDLGSCKAEPDQQRFLPGTLNPTFNFPKDSGKKQAQDRRGGPRGPPCTRVPSHRPGHCPPHLVLGVQEARKGKGFADAVSSGVPVGEMDELKSWVVGTGSLYSLPPTRRETGRYPCDRF